MKILYAPNKRGFSDDLHANVACGFDGMVLESLLELNNAEILYLPNKNTNVRIAESVLERFRDCIVCIDGVVDGVDVLVSDGASFALSYALWTQSPSILCFFGFNGVEFPKNDRYYGLISRISHCVYSLGELKSALLDYEAIKLQKQAGIQEILQGAIL